MDAKDDIHEKEPDSTDRGADEDQIVDIGVEPVGESDIVNIGTEPSYFSEPSRNDAVYLIDTEPVGKAEEGPAVTSPKEEDSD